MAESKNPSLSKEVKQGIGLAVVLISIFVLIGNQIAVATHHEAPAEPPVKTKAP